MLFNFKNKALSQTFRIGGNLVLYRWDYKGIRHFSYGPAMVLKNNSVMYLLNGSLHREDGPAVIYCTGEIKYYLNGTPVEYN